MTKIRFAPREIFEQILEWGVIPTFDLIVEWEDSKVVLVKRRLAPYQNQWALPGLRMFKGENIEDTLLRIAKQELGLKINPLERYFLGQYVGKFKTEHNRQDISTGYCVKVSAGQEINLNNAHFSTMKLITSRNEIPAKIGAMYRFYLSNYFDIID